MTTSQKGAIADTAIVLHALRQGIEVWRPVAEGTRCDLIFGIGRRLVRVQCKTATRQGNVLVVRCYSSRRTRGGHLKRRYSRADVDAIVAYCAATDLCYVLPLGVFGERTMIHLRLGRALNNQETGVHWAADFEFESLDWEGCLGP
jgi:hypothetical protein